MSAVDSMSMALPAHQGNTYDVTKKSALSIDKALIQRCRVHVTLSFIVITAFFESDLSDMLHHGRVLLITSTGKQDNALVLTGAVRAARAVERAGRGVVAGMDMAAVACFGAALRGDVGMSVTPRRERLQVQVFLMSVHGGTQ